MEDENGSNQGSEKIMLSGLLVQLKEKLKDQSKKIPFLESYKLLCEERIKDLAPNHPLPITPQMIGLKPNSSLEIVNFKQKISKLEQQLSHILEKPANSTPNINENFNQYQRLLDSYNKLLKEHKELEETFRNEMQASEEQRIFIEVLKQTIKINMEKLGIEGISVEDFSNFSHIKVAYEQTQKDLNKAKITIKENQYQIDDLRQSLKLQESEFQNYVKNQEIQGKELKKALKRITAYQEETEKLEIEKYRLIDYIENSIKSEEEYVNQIKDLKLSLQNLENDYKNLDIENKSNIYEKNSLMKENDNLTIENYNIIKNLKESQHYFISLKVRVEEKDKTIEKKNQENEELERKIEKFIEEINTLQEEKKALAQEIEETREKLEKKMREYDEKENLLMLTRLSLQKSNETAEIYYNKLRELEANCSDLHKSNKVLNEKYQKLKNHTEELNKELDLEKTLLKDSIERENSLQLKVNELSLNNLELEKKNFYL